jgi:hypothetical protein
MGQPDVQMYRIFLNLQNILYNSTCGKCKSFSIRKFFRADVEGVEGVGAVGAVLEEGFFALGELFA